MTAVQKQTETELEAERSATTIRRYCDKAMEVIDQLTTELAEAKETIARLKAKANEN